MCSCETGLPRETDESSTTAAGTILSTSARNWALPELQIHSGENVLRIPLPVEGEELVIGSSRQSDHILIDPYVSRMHARFFIAGGISFVEDLGSRHGTLLNAERAVGPARLQHGDELRLGRTRVVYLCYLEELHDHSCPGGDSVSMDPCLESSDSNYSDHATARPNSPTESEEPYNEQTAGVEAAWQDRLMQCMRIWWPIAVAAAVVAGVTAVVWYSLARGGGLQGP